MKKVKINYVSHVFQNRHIDKIEQTVIGNLLISNDATTLSFIDNSNNQNELTEFVLKEKSISIKRSNYILQFEENKILECEHKTEYGSLILQTRLKKYFKLFNHFVINYELLINDESIGKYIIKISYEEMK